MGETVYDLRAEISETVGFSTPSGAFRKDDLNVLLDFFDAEDALSAHAVYGENAPLKRWFYRRVAEEAGFDYDAGEGANARPFNSSELRDLRDAVENRVDDPTTV